MPKKYLVANWKMNKDCNAAISLLKETNYKLKNIHQHKVFLSDIQIIICPPFPYLFKTVESDLIKVGAQNCHYEESGAYTGEVSVSIIKSIGVDYILVGHSERRQLFHETSEIIKLKINQILKHNLFPIYCCGEQLETRKKNLHYSFIKEQISKELFHLSENEIRKIIIAYEPIWAIGTGTTPQVTDIENMHQIIRDCLQSRYGKLISDEISILYGGSVNENNAESILNSSNIDGGLVGGASLNSDSFLNILKSIHVKL